MGKKLKVYLYLIFLMIFTINLSYRIFAENIIGSESDILMIIWVIITFLAFTFFIYCLEKNKNWVYPLILTSLTLNIACYLFLYYIFRNAFYLLSPFISILGIFVTDLMIPFSKPKERSKKTAKKEVLKKELAGLGDDEKPELIIEEIKTSDGRKKTKKNLKKHVYFAGKKSSIFHERTCKSINAIPAKNRVRFNSRFEAENNGFTPHDCVH